MGHIIFLFLHFTALMFFSVALLATIPLHLIYCAIGGKRSSEPTPNRWTHVRCPDCKELILKEAVKCRYCGCGLTPQ